MKRSRPEFCSPVFIVAGKKAFVVLLALLVSQLWLAESASAQATSVKRITRQVPPNSDPENPAAKPPPPGAPPKKAPTVVVTAPAAPEKTQAEKDETLRKTIEFQKKRAEEGSPSAQYDLGMRYLEGNGVEKNLELARKWLGEAAKNGSETAAKKLAQIDEKK